jgi:hypothetical protein
VCPLDTAPVSIISTHPLKPSPASTPAAQHVSGRQSFGHRSITGSMPLLRDVNGGATAFVVSELLLTGKPAKAYVANVHADEIRRSFEDRAARHKLSFTSGRRDPFCVGHSVCQHRCLPGDLDG